MIRNTLARRIAAAALIGFGAVLLLLAPSASFGLVAFGLGIALELVGIALEHRDRRG